MGAPKPSTDYPIAGSDHFYMEVLRIVRERALSLGADEDLADEVAQEIAIDQWNRRRRGRPCWDPAKPLESYLKAATFKRLDYHWRTRRRQKERHVKYEEARARAASLVGDDHGVVVTRSLLDTVCVALAAMTEERRDTFLAVREEGLTYAEAAARRGISKETVKILVRRATRDLRQALLDHEEEDQ
ncbi:MAG TPA: sigma-70 family RNA polymerase sigma factor [Gemmatimonadaceae bacterium]|nr:sigma-70 family RNA polymerase sigma factor [Gemmatimonadaceae bacterium]